MKIEQKQLAVFMLKIFILAVFAAMYAAGGSQDFWGGQLWIRRWMATCLLSLVVCELTKDWKYLLAFPLMAGAMTLPYGADLTMQKILLRAVFGITCGLAFNVPNLLNKRWILAVYGIAISGMTSIILGVFNPTPNAIEEQASIAIAFGFTYIIGAPIYKKQEDTI